MKKRFKAFVIILVLLLLIGGGLFAYLYFHRSEESVTSIPELTDEKVTISDKNYYVTPDSEQIAIDDKSGVMYVNDQILVYAEMKVTYEEMSSFAADNNLRIVGYVEAAGLYQMELRDAMTYKKLTELIKELKEDPRVSDAYLNSVFEVTPDDYDEPNDPWDGAVSWDTAGTTQTANWGLLAIKVPAAWEHYEELTDLKLGIIDCGVDTSHEDLDVKLNINSKNEDKTYGDHGTHVAGTMGAKYNNNKGISGVFPKASIYSYATNTYMTDIGYVSAVSILVTDYHCKVINISQNSNRLIGYAADHGNKKAINVLTQSAEAAGKGLRRMLDNGYDFVICVAAGNNNTIKYYKNDWGQYGYATSRWENLSTLFSKEESGGTTGFYNNFLNAITDEVVRSHIICVGSVGLSGDDSLYRYSSFANSGTRVDVAAPGEDIYSSIIKDKKGNIYQYYSGTSMATPHVTGVAALLYAANPDLNGAQVKKIILGTTAGRYYMHDGNYVGLVQADLAVEAAIKAKDEPLSHVINNTTSAGMDICFVIDTTGSMGDEIDDVKNNLRAILAQVAGKTEDYRIAIVDYRDFSERTKRSVDYPSKVQLDFSSDFDTIQSAINGLSLGHGGDDNETVFSGIMEALSLSWRSNAKKVMILMGDAAPLDPEPNTNYTYAYIASELYNVGIGIGTDISDPDTTSINYSNYDLGLGDGSDSLYNVYSINVGGSEKVEDFFQAIASVTGGLFSRVDEASEVTTAIIDSIDTIVLDPVQNVRFQMSDKYVNETIYLYSEEDEFQFAFRLDEDGKAIIEALPEGSYSWETSFSRGTMKVEAGKTKAKIRIEKERFHLSPSMQHLLILIGSGLAAVSVIFGGIFLKIKRK